MSSGGPDLTNTFKVYNLDWVNIKIYKWSKYAVPSTNYWNYSVFNTVAVKLDDFK